MTAPAPAPEPAQEATSASPLDPVSRAYAPQLIVAIGDSGVNPYHEIYYRPHNTRHPCEWVAGWDDCSIPALELSVGEYDSYAQALEADRTKWEALVTGQWYWIPKTNLIGAMDDGSSNVHSTVDDALATETRYPILDSHGHGTGTSSSVLTEAPDALLLIHKGNAAASGLEYAPVVADIQSHSWGAPVPIPLHLVGATGLAQSTFDTFDPATILFAAAGNEAPFPASLDYFKVHPRTQIVGGGYAPNYWETMSWNNYDFASWFCRPTAAMGSINEWRPRYCGTSFATPTAAGTAAAALLEIRHQEGYLGRSTETLVNHGVSRARFIDALRLSATYRAAPDHFEIEPGVTAAPTTADYEDLNWGYGWLDAQRVPDIVDCALRDRRAEKSQAALEHLNTLRGLREVTTGQSE